MVILKEKISMKNLFNFMNSQRIPFHSNYSYKTDLLCAALSLLGLLACVTYLLTIGIE